MLETFLKGADISFSELPKRLENVKKNEIFKNLFGPTQRIFRFFIWHQFIKSKVPLGPVMDHETV